LSFLPSVFASPLQLAVAVVWVREGAPELLKRKQCRTPPAPPGPLSLARSGGFASAKRKLNVVLPFLLPNPLAAIDTERAVMDGSAEILK
jgi:hypothetical protein